jgi:hypothetical protein
MATQAGDYIDKSFPERVQDEENSVKATLEDGYEVVAETIEAPVRVVREVFYDPSIKVFSVGACFGSAVTLLAFLISAFIK